MDLSEGPINKNRLCGGQVCSSATVPQPGIKHATLTTLWGLGFRRCNPYKTLGASKNAIPSALGPRGSNIRILSNMLGARGLEIAPPTAFRGPGGPQVQALQQFGGPGDPRGSQGLTIATLSALWSFGSPSLQPLHYVGGAGTECFNPYNMLAPWRPTTATSKNLLGPGG